MRIRTPLYADQTREFYAKGETQLRNLKNIWKAGETKAKR